MKKNEIINKYNEIKTKYDKEELPSPDRTNCYICKKCRHITKTRDIDKGVTPFLFECENCREYATSSFYADVAPQLEPTWEWYRPSLEEILQPGFEPLDHVLKGGIIPRKITT